MLSSSMLRFQRRRIWIMALGVSRGTLKQPTKQKSNAVLWVPYPDLFQSFQNAPYLPSALQCLSLMSPFQPITLIDWMFQSASLCSGDMVGFGCQRSDWLSTVKHRCSDSLHRWLQTAAQTGHPVKICRTGIHRCVTTTFPFFGSLCRDLDEALQLG